MRYENTNDPHPTAPERKRRRAGNCGLGRPRGSVNRKTLEMRAAVEDAQRRLRMMVPDGTLLDAHALLQTVYRDNDMPIFLRVEAAKSAVKFEKPALSSTQLDATVRIGAGQELVAATIRLKALEAAELSAADVLSAELGSDHLANARALASLVESAHTTAHTRTSADAEIGHYVAALATSGK